MAPTYRIFASERVCSWSEPVFFGGGIFPRVLGHAGKLPNNTGCTDLFLIKYGTAVSEMHKNCELFHIFHYNK